MVSFISLLFCYFSLQKPYSQTEQKKIKKKYEQGLVFLTYRDFVKAHVKNKNKDTEIEKKKIKDHRQFTNE